MVPAIQSIYALPPYSLGIVETMGEYIARLRLQPEVAPDFGQKHWIPGWEKVQMRGTLDDGSTFCYYLSNSFGMRKMGCELRLRLLFPAASPQSLLDEHAQHLAIEFRSFVTAAFERKNKASA